MLKPCVAWFFAVASAQDTGFMRTLFVEYVDGTSDGHFQFGKSIGEAMGPDIQAVWAGDLQLHAMETWAPRPDVQTAPKDASNQGHLEFYVRVECLPQSKVRSKRLTARLLRHVQF